MGGGDEEMIEGLKRESFQYFLREVSPSTGLVADGTQPDSPSSIAATGMGLCAYVVGAHRRYIARKNAVGRTLKILRFLSRSPQNRSRSATGYKGFYYHFLEMNTGRRTWKSELSTIDTALLCAGMLFSAQYFDRDNREEREIRKLSDELYRRVDWKWALNRQNTLTHGWTPEKGFLPHRWDYQYNESLILYVLALGSPTHPIPSAGYEKWISTFRLSSHLGIRHLAAGPLFIHQLSQVWLDVRGLGDAFNRRVGFDYFENSRRATILQQKYAVKNPKKFRRYGKHHWGLSAGNGPGPARKRVLGKTRVFYGYEARGFPNGKDDGTIAPWAVIAALPFEPKIVLATARHLIERFNRKRNIRNYGFDSSFNATFPGEDGRKLGWISPYKFGLNQGPVILMIENYQTELIWKISRRCPYFQNGLARAGFLKLPQPGRRTDSAL